ncbi:MAG: hypothetical protein JW894_12435 [Bacteroidales bacterium]|nr:hypothetical protein [Bacteroidales bacterium]
MNNLGNYMVEVELPVHFDEDFISLIPYQRAYISKMMKKGNISSYSLSLDRSLLWVVVAAESIQDVKNIIGSFPIFNYITFKIHPLMFNEIKSESAPHFWLN